MLKRPRLTKINQDYIKKEENSLMKTRMDFNRETIQQKNKAKNKFWFEEKEGVNYCISWIKDHYRTHKGIPLNWEEPYIKEYITIFCHPWLSKVVVLKAAQMGFTEIAIALCAFSLTEVRAGCMLAVNQQRKLQDIVSPRFQPSFDAILPIQELREKSLRMRGRKDTDTKQRNIDVGGVSIFFSYAGKIGKNNSRTVSSSFSSVPVDLTIIADEFEAWPSGALNVLKQRTSASDMPNCLLRAGSTPGSKGGIMDVEVQLAKYFFDWWVTCPHCKKGQFLSPFGNIFKPVKDPNTGYYKYLDKIGVPLDWHCLDRSTLRKKVKTAYMGCQHCDDDIGQESIKKGFYKCKNTGETAKDFNGRLTKEKKKEDDSVCIKMPRLASLSFNLVERLEMVINARSIVDRCDAFQQGFGEITSFSMDGIDREMLLAAIGKQKPDWCKTPDLVTVGIDQGVSQHIAVALAFYWDRDAKDPLDVWSNALVELLDYQYIYKVEGIIEFASKYNTDFLGIDIEPEAYSIGMLGKNFRANRTFRGKSAISFKRGREERAQYSGEDYFKERGIVFPLDQVYLKGESHRRRKKNIQGEEFNIISLDRTFGLDSVMEVVASDRLYLPEGFFYDPQDKDNFIYQMLTSEKTADSKWIERTGEPDHALHAFNFGLVAGLCWYDEPKPTQFSFLPVNLK